MFDDEKGIADCYQARGRLATAERDYPRAGEQLAAAVRRQASIDNRRGVAEACEAAAELADALGDTLAAASLLAHADAVLKRQSQGMSPRGDRRPSSYGKAT